MWYMPDTMGHDNGGINCMAMVDDKVYTGGRDSALFVWSGQAAGDEFQLQQDSAPMVLTSSVCALHYEPTSKWLFCGLWDGTIQAYCKEPQVADTLAGHRRSVSSLTMHSGVLVSGSNDATVRLWTLNQQTNRFQSHGSPMQNPSGPVNVVKILGGSLWVGGNGGVTCFDLNTLQPKGTIESPHPVTGMLEFQNHMITTYRNGDVKIFDATGGVTYNHASAGDHTTNTASTLMMHPTENKPMLLCGQTLGYVTAYDLPEFRPRGSWVCKPNSDIRSIIDVKFGGMFITGGAHSDVIVWRWTGQTQGQPAGVAASPFGAGHSSAPVASSPFGGGGVGGDSMM